MPTAPSRMPPLHVGRSGADQMPLAHRLCDAILDHDPRAIRQALASGASTDLRLQIPQGSRDEWVDVLTWAVWEETHSPSRRARSENVPSSGIVEALIDGGAHSWTALSTYPSRRWTLHPSFAALENDTFDRLLTLQGNHPLIREAKAGRASRNVVPRWPSVSGELDTPTWLGWAVHQDRLDVVKHWIALGAPVTQDGPCYQTPWWRGWYRRCQDDSMGFGTRDRTIVDLLEKRLLATATDAQWRTELIGLLGLLNETLTDTHLAAPGANAAIADTVERAVQQRPIDLVLTDDEARKLRDPSGVRAQLAEQERRLMHRTFAPAGSPVAGLGLTGLATAERSRKRL